jgi:virulence-associated protein VagC
MNTYIMKAEALNLPQPLAIKFAGQEVELIEHGDSVLISPTEDIIDKTCGMFKSDGHRVDRFLEEKHREIAEEDEEDEYEYRFATEEERIKAIHDLCGVFHERANPELRKIEREAYINGIVEKYKKSLNT